LRTGIVANAELFAQHTLIGHSQFGRFGSAGVLVHTFNATSQYRSLMVSAPRATINGQEMNGELYVISLDQ